MNTTSLSRENALCGKHRYEMQTRSQVARLLTIFCVSVLLSACGDDAPQTTAETNITDEVEQAVAQTGSTLADQTEQTSETVAASVTEVANAAEEKSEDLSAAVADTAANASEELATATANAEAIVSDAATTVEQATDAAQNTLAETVTATAETDSDYTATDAVFGDELPYPVYPNGRKYRVGGENGLKIVVFETEDAFAEVDNFYQQITSSAGMERLEAMSDYVRYSQDGDEDPWATHRPGIVIHQFNDDQERAAVGAAAESMTNIIMSY